MASLLAVGSIALPIALLGAGCQPDAATNVNQSADIEVTVPVDEAEVMEEDATEDVTSQTVTVSTVGNTFSPATVTIAAGDSVEFNLAAIHNAVEVSQSTWEASTSGALSGGFSVGFGGTETVTFDEPGTYYYVCEPHVALGMKGTIIVE